jgi:restriction system protein
VTTLQYLPAWLYTTPLPVWLTDIQWMALEASLVLAFLLIIGYIKSCIVGRRWRVKAAKKALRRVRRIDNTDQQIAYLRKIDPFIFEELVLWVLKDQGHRIKRNKRYTGDGGIDGQVWIKGKRHLVQAKRYSGYIRKSHLTDFDDLCKRRRCKGLFVHTGILGGGSEGNETKRVTILGGKSFLEVL